MDIGDIDGVSMAVQINTTAQCGPQYAHGTTAFMFDPSALQEGFEYHLIVGRVMDLTFEVIRQNTNFL